jgi:predicted dehydrogenase
MNAIRTGIIGIGTIGSFHAKSVAGSNHMELSAVCDIIPQRADAAAARYNARAFYSHTDLLNADICEAIVIATPHYSHTQIGIDALHAGMHVLVEKPLSVHTADCKRLIAAHSDDSQVFAIMYNQRTDPYYRRIRAYITQGALGRVKRVTWIVTNWFRTDAYYRSSNWRATWQGEGGGLLLNQCMHQLDLLQWLCGMPRTVRGYCGFGKYHDIEVEDDVTALFDYDSGASGVFISSSGEFPGTNRLEITGDRGSILLEDNRLKAAIARMATQSFSAGTDMCFSNPDVETYEYSYAHHGGQHEEILDNFAGGIHGETELVAPARDGINAVELANAILYSALQNRTVSLPLDSMKYQQCLDTLVQNSSSPGQHARIQPEVYDDAYLEAIRKQRWQSHAKP